MILGPEETEAFSTRSNRDGKGPGRRPRAPLPLEPGSRLDALWLAAYLIAGWLFALVTPPFQVPDEPAHFYRAYHLSRGDLWPQRWGETVGGWLPGAVVAAGNTRGLPFHPEKSIEPSALLEDIRAELERPSGGEEMFTSFPNVAVYPPWAYLPHSMGLLLARQVTPSPTIQLYVGRCFGFTLFSLLVFLGIRLARPHQGFLWLVALSPMTMFQLAGISADGLALASAFVCAGLLWRWTVEPDVSISRREWWLFLGFAALLASSKAVYSPLPLVVLGLPAVGKLRLMAHPAASRAVGAGLLLLLTLGLTLTWLWVSRQWFVVPQRPGVTIAPLEQLKFVMEHPLSFCMALWNQVYHNLFRYFMGLVGNLGWRDTPLPNWYYPFWLICFACLAWLTPARPFRTRLAAALVLALSSVFIGIFLAMYLGFNPPGAGDIVGVQGRYFLPLLPFACLFLPMLMSLVKKPLNGSFPKQSDRYPSEPAAGFQGLILISFAIISVGAAWYALVMRFYG